MRIKNLSLVDWDVEELSVEQFRVFCEEISCSDIAGPVIVPVFVVKAVGVEAVDFSLNVSWVLQQVPEPGGIRGISGEAAATTHNGDRLVGVGHDVI